MLGSWHRSNLLTFVGMAAAVVGVGAATRHALSVAVACLVVAGLCDLFDGSFARRFQRDDRTRALGVQLDSLADVLSFVALPIAIAAAYGCQAWWQLAAAVLYALAGINRLAEFNLGADGRPESTTTHYRGLPVTWSALVFALAALAGNCLGTTRDEVFALVMVVLAVAFVADLPVPRPRGLPLVVLLVLAVAILVALATLGVVA